MNGFLARTVSYGKQKLKHEQIIGMNGFYLEHKFNHEQFSTLNKNKSMNGFLE
jgi:hypothetical protein